MADEYEMDETDEEEELLEEIRSRFESSKDHWSEWRDEARIAFRYYSGHQWSDEDTEKLLEQQRQPITFNRCGPFIDAVLGHEANNRQEIRYIPRSNGDAKVNEVLTKVAHFFLDSCDGEYAQSDAFRDMLITGCGFSETRLDDEDNPEYDLVVESVNPLEMLVDPSSSKPCFSDARYMFRIQSMSKDEAKSLFPDWSGDTNGEAWDFYSDEGMETDGGDASSRDSYRGSNDDNSALRDIIILQYQYKTYENYHIAIHPMTGEQKMISEDDYEENREEIEASGINVKSRRKVVHKRCFLIGDEFVKKDTVYENGFTFTAVTGKRDRSKRVWRGLMHSLLDVQMWSNKFLSQMLHIINSQAKGGVNIEESAVDNISEFEAKYARPGAVLVYKDGALVNNRVSERTSAQFPAAFDRLLQYANESFSDVTGVNAEMMGMADREQAGVLEYQRRQSAVAILAPLFDSLRLYRKMFGRGWLHYIQNYVSDGRIVRITVDHEVADKIQQQGMPQGMPGMPPQGMPAQGMPPGMPQQGMPPQPPKQGTRDIAVPLTPELLHSDETAEYDVIVDQAAAAPNQKEATWAVVSQLGPVLKEVITPEVLMKLLEYSPLPASLMEELKAMSQEKAQQGPPPNPEIEKAKAELQMKAQAQQQEMQIKTQSKQAEMQLKQAEAQADIQLEKTKVEAQIMLEREKAQAQLQIESMKNESNFTLQRDKAEFDKQLKMEMAAIDVKAKNDATDYASSKFGGEQGKMADSLGMLTGQMADSNTRVAEALQALSEGMNRPKQIVRGPDGRAIGVQ